MRYLYVFFLLALIAFGCNENNPQKAAKEYCECLQLQYKNNVDTSTAFSNCDSIIEEHYTELHTYKMGNTTTSEEWNSVVKFHTAFLELTFQNCCSLIGNCDVINFRNSLLKHYTSYSFKHDIDAVDFIKKLGLLCSGVSGECKYKLDFQERLIASDINGSDYSFLYYEIVIFDNAQLADSIIRQMQNPCSQKALPGIISYMKIDDKTLFIFNYQNFDFETIEKLLRENFHDVIIKDVGD